VEPYRLEFYRSALSALRRLPQREQARVYDRLDRLAAAPYGDVRKLEGRDGYRIRIGTYRVLYDIDDAARLITVRLIANRKDAYR